MKTDCKHSQAIEGERERERERQSVQVAPGGGLGRRAAGGMVIHSPPAIYGHGLVPAVSLCSILVARKKRGPSLLPVPSLPDRVRHLKEYHTGGKIIN